MAITVVGSGNQSGGGSNYLYEEDNKLVVKSGVEGSQEYAFNFNGPQNAKDIVTLSYAQSMVNNFCPTSYFNPSLYNFSLTIGEKSVYTDLAGIQSPCLVNHSSHNMNFVSSTNESQVLNLSEPIDVPVGISKISFQLLFLINNRLTIVGSVPNVRIGTPNLYLALPISCFQNSNDSSWYKLEGFGFVINDTTEAQKVTYMTLG